MNLRKHHPYLSNIEIALSGASLGAAITLKLLSSKLLYAKQAQAAAVVELSTAGIWLAGLLVILLLLIRGMADRRAEMEQFLLKSFLDHIPDSVFFKDRASRFVCISRATAAHFGIKDRADARNKTDFDFFSAEHASRAFADEQEILRTGKPMIGLEEKETWPDGRENWVMTTKVPLTNGQGRIIGTMGVSHDITDRKQAEVRINYMALHDGLTGLPNRVLLLDRLMQSITLAARNRKEVGVLMLDLDRFKTINDSLGHYVGDRLLEAVARRLTECLRESDIVGRLGGDEFVVVLPLIAGRADSELVAQKIQVALTAPFEIEGRELRIGVSIGICQYPADGEQAEALLQNADAAMYEAKRSGRGTCCFFSAELTEGTRRRQKMEGDLRQACARGEFSLCYQPLVSTATGRINGVEALLRWRHPEEGPISPSQFIPQLEEMGLMEEVGKWVLRTACQQNANWQKSGLPPVRVAVNLSAQQFSRGNLSETVETVLRETGLNPKWLELELTESLTMDDSEQTLRTMRAIKKLGVSLSLDDFGTGWSSLGYLQKFQFDRIKIGQTFMRDVALQPAAETVVRSIINLGRNLGLSCVAEGVETRQQLEYLQKQACSEIQGFLFSPAVPAGDCGVLLASGTFGVDEDRTAEFAPGNFPPSQNGGLCCVN